MGNSIWFLLLLQAVLIALNAIFACAEIAVLSINEVKLERMAEQGDKRAKRLFKLTREPAKFLSTIQVAITLSGFLGSAFAADNFSDPLVDWVLSLGVAIPRATLDTLALILITVILSYFTLVFGELVPKRVAMKRAESLGLGISGLVSSISIAFKPIVWFLSVSTDAILRLMGSDPNETEEQVSEEEIRMMVDAGSEMGTIDNDERDFIQNVFEFDTLTARDLMVHRTDMATLALDDDEQTILDTIRESGLSRFPVYEEDADDIVGILPTRTYLLNFHMPEPKPIRELLRPAYFVPETVPADVLFRDMQAKKFHMALVVDEYGGTSGLVTLEDLLEELVGNIYDEFDPQEEQDIIRLDDGRWRVSGSANLEELFEAMGRELPEDDERDYDSLGGLVFAQLSVIPEDGSRPVVEALGLRIRVEELFERRVEWALVEEIHTYNANT